MISWQWYCSRVKPPSQAARQRWQKTRDKGKKRFVLRVGVLQWGGFMFLVTTAQYAIRKPQLPRRMIDYVVEAAINLLIWPIAGYFFGTRIWDFYETYFGEYNRQSPPDPTGST
jgi:hypothetical protein